MLILILIGLLIVADLLLLTFDKYAWSLFLTGVVIAVAWFFVPEVEAFAKEAGWKTLVMYVFGYLGIGIGIALVKWVLRLFAVASSLRDMVEGFSGNPVEKVDEFFKYIDRTCLKDHRLAQTIADNRITLSRVSTQEELIAGLTPRARDNVHRIAFWTLQWPLVVISTLIEDLLLKLAKHLSRLFDFLFNKFGQMIIARAFKR